MSFYSIVSNLTATELSLNVIHTNLSALFRVRYFHYSALISDFPFNLVNGISARFDTFPETLLYNSNPIIQDFHLNFKIIPAGSARRVAKNTRKAGYLREEPTYSHYFGTQPLYARRIDYLLPMRPWIPFGLSLAISARQNPS